MFQQYLRDLREAVGALAASGLSTEEIVARFELPAPYREWRMKRYLERNIRHLVRELSDSSPSVRDQR
jgi:hypothetical protein